MHRLSHLLLAAPAACLLASCAGTPLEVSLPAAEPAPAHTEHFVPNRSIAPGYNGYISNLYVREIPAAEPATGEVALFVHGAGTPAEVAFDVPASGYSWMRFLADRGVHVFAMDLTGYGRSTRPPQMDNRCNLSTDDQYAVFGDVCAAVHDSAITTIASDWHDIDAVVNYILRRTPVEQVHLIGWSQGGPRTGGYAVLHPDKVKSLVQLAPAYRRDYPPAPNAELLQGVVMTKQTRSDFIANWDRQVGCTDQYDPAVAQVIFDEMLASDPVGATWGPGLRRAPRVPTFGWGQAVVGNMQTPLLMVAGGQDEQITPDLVENLYADYSGPDKVLITMPCASHNAMWESDAQLLFEASLQWITTGAYLGKTRGRFTLP